MYKPKKYVRLDLLPRMPRLPDIRNLLNEAKKARACTVELPWRSENLGLRFSLTVRVEVGGGEPIWTLYEGEGSKSRVMWSTGFNEVELLYDVLTLSLPTEGPNIFAPYQDKPAEASSARGDQVSDSQISYARSYEKTGGDAAPSDFYKPIESSNAALNAEYANFLMTEEPVAVPASKAPTEEIEKPRSTAPMTADMPLPDLDAVQGQAQAKQDVQTPANAAAPVAPNAPAAAPVPPGYPQPPYPYPPQPGYAYPAGYPYAQPLPPNYNYPPGYAPGPGYPAGYPYGPTPYPYQQMPPGYPQQPASADTLSAASTVPLSPGAAPGYPGLNAPDPYASHVVAPHPDLVKKRPNVMLGSFLVDAGLVPKATIDAALQVQTLVSQGTLSAMKAAEAVRRAHIRGGSVEPEPQDHNVKNDMAVRVKPQIGQVLVMAGIISAAQLKTALSLQDVLRSGNMAMEEAVRTLAQTLNTKEEIKPGASDEDPEEIKQSLALLKKSGLLNDQDLDLALKKRADKGGLVSKILVASGALDKITLEAAVTCQRHLTSGKLKMEQVVPALHYCQRMRVSFEDAASELGLTV